MIVKLITQAAGTPGRQVIGHLSSGVGAKTMFDSSYLRALGVLDESLGGGSPHRPGYSHHTHSDTDRASLQRW
jgi:hypothetical protein